MGLFRFRARVVEDPLAQQNFEQLEAELSRGWAVGDLKYSAVSSAQAGWLLADNSGVTTAYPALRQALISAGSPWGTDGSGNPRTPPGPGRTVIGVGAGAGLTTRALGDVFGGESTPLPNHVHPQIGTLQVAGGSPFGCAESIVNTGNPTGNPAITTIQPSMAAYLFIKT